MLYESSRRFEVWGWRVGHGGLLLRSNPTPEYARRVEVLFKPAYAACLPSWLDGITLCEADSAEVADWHAQHHGVHLHDYNNLFMVSTGSVRGWVVGGSANGREDDGDYDSPPLFDGLAPPPGVRELFTTYEG
ncbi:MAG: hypothetical protein QOJ79_2677 [Actinomycetota bacterium]|jgi:hypothetical protein|nr:hypothetical protein [Actinomycetota bacterium]